MAKRKKVVKFKNEKSSTLLLFDILAKKLKKIFKSYKILGETLKYK